MSSGTSRDRGTCQQCSMERDLEEAASGEGPSNLCRMAPSDVRLEERPLSSRGSRGARVSFPAGLQGLSARGLQEGSAAEDGAKCCKSLRSSMPSRHGTGRHADSDSVVGPRDRRRKHGPRGADPDAPGGPADGISEEAGAPRGQPTEVESVGSSQLALDAAALSRAPPETVDAAPAVAPAAMPSRCSGQCHGQSLEEHAPAWPLELARGAPNPYRAAHQEMPVPSYSMFSLDQKVNYEITAEHAVRVRIEAKVHEIRAIDDMAELFAAVFTLHLYWIDPALREFRSKASYFASDGSHQERLATLLHCPGIDDHKEFFLRIHDEVTKPDRISVPPARFRGLEQPDWESDASLFRPRWSFLNAVEAPIELVQKLELQYVSDNGGHIHQKIKYQGKFTHKFRLQRFPFDHQQLRIKISAEEPLQHMQWEKQGTKAGQPSHFPPEWESEGRPAELHIQHPAYHGYQQVQIRVYMKRLPDFFIKNVVIMMSFFCVAAYAASLLDPAKVEERSAILLGVLLVSSGYRHMVAQWVPRRPYNTYLDTYTFVGFSLQIAALVESVMTVKTLCQRVDDSSSDVDGRSGTSIECSKAAASFDEVYFNLTFGMWLLAHVCAAACWFCPRIFCARRSVPAQLEV